MRIVYEDAHLIEVEVCASMNGWTAETRAYASAEEIIESARRLRDWVSQPSAPFMLELGADTGIGWASLRFYLIDKSGHLMCHLRLATMSSTFPKPREEETWRLSLEVPTEPALIDRFSDELVSMASNRRGEAVLRGVLK
jgi:hypothetical protein